MVTTGHTTGISEVILEAGPGLYQMIDNEVEGWGPLVQVEGWTIMATPDGLAPTDSSKRITSTLPMTAGGSIRYGTIGSTRTATAYARGP